MTDNVEYGPEIAVDGMPDWLGGDEKIHCQWFGDYWYPHGPVEAKHCTHTKMTAIRLPADHWAYKAIDAGFIPWGGGDAAPEGVTSVLFRVGGPLPTSGTGLRWTHIGLEGDIIGYKRGAGTDAAIDEIRTGDLPGFETVGELMDDLNDRVTLAKMTEDDAREKAVAYYDRWLTDELKKVQDVIIAVYTDLGLIRPATLLDQFEDHHGSLDHNQRAILEIYQEWVEGQ